MKALKMTTIICLLFSGLCFAWCPDGDVNNDCRVNFDDFALLAGSWLVEGQNAVPDVVGMTQADAETAITEVYLTVGTVTEDYSGTYAAGLVMAQDPAAGVLLGPDEPVDLVVSLGIRPDITWITINNDPGVPGHEAFDGEMSKYETTNAQYCQYLNAALASGDIIVEGSYVKGNSGSYSGQSYYNLAGSGYTGYGATNGGAARINWTGSTFTVDSGFENHPVTYVSWYGAMAFASYYGWRLPTEWGWQAVADFDGSYTYGCGTTINTSIANYRDSVHPHGTTAVGAFGTYGYGLCDMSGNVWEWTDSCYYSGCSPDSRVIRGGCWLSYGYFCAVSDRRTYHPFIMDYYGGFRVCR